MLFDQQCSIRVVNNVFQHTISIKIRLHVTDGRVTMLLHFGPSPSIIPLFIFIFLLYRLRQCCSHLNLLCTALDSSVLDETDLSLAMSAISLTHLNQDSIVSYFMFLIIRNFIKELIYTILLYMYVHVYHSIIYVHAYHSVICTCSHWRMRCLIWTLPAELPW